jgi:hypothetical protein
MTMQVYTSASVEGAAFHPSALSRKWQKFLLRQIDVGMISKTGRYRGQPAPNGFAIVGHSEEKGLTAQVELIEEMHEDLVANGAQMISVFVTLESVTKATWTIEPELMLRLGTLHVSLLIAWANRR